MSTFPGYRVVEKSASGTLCDVYRAERVADGRPVSVTALRPELHSDALVAGAFRQQARLARQLQHANIAHAFSEDDGTDDADRLWYAHELVTGPPLAERLKAVDAGQKRFANEEICRIGLQICAALECAHKHTPTVLHGGLTPRTVFIPDSEDVRLVGFGVPVSAEDGAAAPPALGYTAYLAPEQVHVGTIEPRSDLYSLGATLYAVATGRAPTDAAAQGQEATQPLYPQVSPRTLRPDLHPELEGLILRLMAVDPQERPRDVAAVRGSLERIAESLERGEVVPAAEGAAWAGSADAAPATTAPSTQAARRPKRAKGSVLGRWTRRLVMGLVLLALTAVALVVHSVHLPPIEQRLPPEVMAVRDATFKDLSVVLHGAPAEYVPPPSRFELLAGFLLEDTELADDPELGPLIHDYVAARKYREDIQMPVEWPGFLEEFTEYYSTRPVENVRERLTHALHGGGMGGRDAEAALRDVRELPVPDAALDRLIQATSRALVDVAVDPKGREVGRGGGLEAARRYFAAFYAFHSSQLRALDASQHRQYLENWVWPHEEGIEAAPAKVVKGWKARDGVRGLEFFHSEVVSLREGEPAYLVPALFITERRWGKSADGELVSDGEDKKGVSFGDANSTEISGGVGLPTLLEYLAVAARRTGACDSIGRESFHSRAPAEATTARADARLVGFPNPAKSDATTCSEWAVVDKLLLGEAAPADAVGFRFGKPGQVALLQSGDLTSDDGSRAFDMRFRYCLRLANVIRLDWPAPSPRSVQAEE